MPSKKRLPAADGGNRPAREPARDRLYEPFEHDHLPYSVGPRFVRLIVSIIFIDVLVADTAQAHKGDLAAEEIVQAGKMGGDSD
jgi:hypothetical protein